MSVSGGEIAFGVALAGAAAGLLLSLYHTTYYQSGRRLAPLYLMLAVFQLAQYAFTSKSLWASVSGAVSYGSAALFPAGLMLLLVIYIRKDIFEFYRVCQWLLWVNLLVCAVACPVRVFAGLGWGGPAVAELTDVLGMRRVLLGTALLLVDAYVLAWVFDRARDRGPLARLLLPLVAALGADAVGFGLLMGWLRGEPPGAAVGLQLATKAGAAAACAAVLYVYLRVWGRAELADPPRGLTRWQFARSLLWLPPVRWVLVGRARAWAYQSRFYPLGEPACVRPVEWANFQALESSARGALDRFAVLRVGGAAVRSERAEQIADPVFAWARRHKVFGWLTFAPDGTARVLLCGQGKMYAAVMADQLAAKYGETFTPGAVTVAAEGYDQETDPMTPAIDPADRLALTAAPGAATRPDMSPELSAELVAVAEAADGRPVLVTHSGRTYEVTCRPIDAPVAAPDGDGDGDDVPPGVRAAQRAFWDALPGLVKDRRTRGKWVLFGPGGLIRADRRVAALYNLLGQNPAERYLGRAEPTDRPPWEPEQVFVPDRCAWPDEGADEDER